MSQLIPFGTSNPNIIFLPPWDLDVFINSVAIRHVQSFGYTARQNKEVIEELGTTYYWEKYDVPTIDITIDRNCVGDSSVMSAIASGSNDTTDLVIDSSGDLVVCNVKFSGNGTVFDCDDAVLTGVDWNFAVGGNATESWRFTGSSVSSATGISPTDNTAPTALTAGTGYGAIRASDISVNVLGLTLRVQSVRLSVTVNRQELFELNTSVRGPYARFVNLPITCTAAISMYPSGDIFDVLGTIENPRDASEASGDVTVTIHRENGTTFTYTMADVVMDDIAFRGDLTAGGLLDLTVSNHLLSWA